MANEFIPISPGEKPKSGLKIEEGDWAAQAQQPAEPEVIPSTDMHRKLQEFVQRASLGEIIIGRSRSPKRTQRNAWLDL